MKKIFYLTFVLCVVCLYSRNGYAYSYAQDRVAQGYNPPLLHRLKEENPSSVAKAPHSYRSYSFYLKEK